MAAIGLRLWWVAFAVLLWTPHISCRNVTHEDIRDAMLSLVHMFRQSEDKLERHEYREKALGDQVKKMLTGLERKHRALEPLKGMISRLDERLSNVETILLQRDEREKTTQKKTNEALEAIQKSLQSLSSSVANNLKPSKDAAVENNLTTNDDALVRRLDTSDTKLESIKSEIENLKKALSRESLRAMCLEVGSDGNPLEKHISEAEKLLNKYELKLNEYNTNSSKPPVDIVTLNEVSLADEAWHNKMAEVMERQEKDIKKIQQLLSDAESIWKELPRTNDLNSATNQTLAAIETAKHQLKESDDLSTSKVTGKLREMGDRLATTNRDIQASLTESNTMSERVYDNITRAYHHLITEVQTLTKNENVMLRTADDVLDTKKRIEYSVHRILMELSDVIRTQTTDFNKTMNERLDVIESSILQSQSGGMTNLSAKIESEMSQVWRQIGLMAHQLNSSKILLDKLTDQTNHYVNGSSTAMDNMKDKVGAIITRMKEVDDSLNYLVGRMSLVAEEFNKIKKAISQELDRAKTSFRDMNDKLDKELTSSPRDKTSVEKKD